MREENLLTAKNLLRVIEKLQRAGRRGDIVGVIANELDAKDRKAAQQKRAADGAKRPAKIPRHKHTNYPHGDGAV